MKEPSEESIRDFLDNHKDDLNPDNLPTRLQEHEDFAELVQFFDELWSDLFDYVEALEHVEDEDDVFNIIQEVARLIVILTDVYQEITQEMLDSKTRDDDTADWVELMELREKNAEEKFNQMSGADIYEAIDKATLWSLADVHKDYKYADDQTDNLLATTFSDSLEKTIHNVLFYFPLGELSQKMLKETVAKEREYEKNSHLSLTDNEIVIKLNDICMKDENIRQPDMLQQAINDHDVATRYMLEAITEHIKEKTIPLEKVHATIDTWTEKLTTLAATIMDDKETENPKEVFAYILCQGNLYQYGKMAHLNPQSRIELMSPLLESMIIDMFTEYDEKDPYMTYYSMTPAEACQLLKSHLCHNIALLNRK